MTEQQAVTSRYYVMNMLSNLNSNFAPRKTSHLQDNINRIGKCLEDPKLQKFLGKWEIVWGPALVNSKAKYITSKYVTDHAMYLAYSVEKNEYFIGISGTNGISKTNWIDEDVNVETMTSWPPQSLEVGHDLQGAKVSKGAKLGFDALTAMKSPGSDKTLIVFLEENTKANDCTITVGGHSLGGCLTPLMASAIALSLSNKNVKVQAYPTAGPTPGNTAFADHLADKLHLYHAVINMNDLIPQAWGFQGLKKLRDQYNSWKFVEEHIETRATLVDNWLLWAQHNANQDKNNYQRNPASAHENFIVETWENQLITGKDSGELKKYKKGISDLKRYVLAGGGLGKLLRKINNKQISEAPVVSDYLMNFSRFFVQMGLQHVKAYNNAKAVDGKPVPIVIEESVRKALSECFALKKGQQAWTSWFRGAYRKILSDLSGLVWDWVKDQPTQSEDIVNDLPEALSKEDLQLMQSLDQIFELESEEAQEEALKAMDIDLSFMPWNQNPFSF